MKIKRDITKSKDEKLEEFCKTNFILKTTIISIKEINSIDLWSTRALKNLINNLKADEDILITFKGWNKNVDYLLRSFPQAEVNYDIDISDYDSKLSLGIKEGDIFSCIKVIDSLSDEELIKELIYIVKNKKIEKHNFDFFAIALNTNSINKKNLLKKIVLELFENEK